MPPISILIGAFIGGTLGVIAGEWINHLLALRRAKRLLRERGL